MHYCTTCTTVLHVQCTYILGSEDIPTGLGLGQGEYYPYVYYKMNIDMIATTSVLN